MNTFTNFTKFVQDRFNNDAYEVLQHFSGEAASIAADLDIDLQSMNLHLDGRRLTGNQVKVLDEKSRGKVMVVAEEGQAPSGVRYPRLTFFTQRNGGCSDTFNGYNCLWQMYKLEKEQAKLEEERRKVRLGMGVDEHSFNDRIKKETEQHLSVLQKQKRTVEHNKSVEQKKIEKLRTRSIIAEDNEEQEDNTNALEKERLLFESLPKARANHGYIVKKDLSSIIDVADLREGVDRYGRKYLAVKMSNSCSDFTGMQKIYESGAKYFTKGMKVKGSYLVLGNIENHKEVRVVEGLASGAAVYLATQQPVAVAYNANNLTPVAKELRSVYRGLRITICADNDTGKKEAGNTGMRKGLEASMAANAKFVAPDFLDFLDILDTQDDASLSDFDDLRRIAGIDEVKKQLAENACPAPASKYELKLHAIRYGGTNNIEKNVNKFVYEAVSVFPLGKSSKEIARDIELILPTKGQEHIYEKVTKYTARLVTDRKLNAIRSRAILDRKGIVMHDHKVLDDELVQKIKEVGGAWLIKAPMGYGKTENVIAPLLRDYEIEGEQPLAVSPRISLSVNLAERLKTPLYQNVVGSAGNLASLSCCVNSIVKPNLTPLTGDTGVIFYDEIAQVLSHLASGTVDNREEVFELLKKQIKNAKLIVLVDANINDAVVDLVREVRVGEDINLVDIEADFSDKEIYYTSKCSVISEMAEDALVRGEKVLITTDSKRFAGKISEGLRKRYKDKKILRVDSGTTSKEDVQKFLQDPNEESKKYDLVIYTPVISSGISIINKYFTAHFAYFCGAVTPGDALQMINRDRCFSRIHVALDPRKRDNETDEGRILLQCLANRKETLVNYDGDGKEPLISYEFRPFDKFYAKQKSMENADKNDFGNNFLLNAMHDGYRIEKMARQKNSKKGVALQKEGMTELDESYVKRILNAEDITSVQAESIDRKHFPTLEEQDAVIKHKVKQGLGLEELTGEDVMHAYNKGLHTISNTQVGLSSREEIQGKDVENMKKGGAIALEKNMTPMHDVINLFYKCTGINRITGKGKITKENSAKFVAALLKKRDAYEKLRLGTKLRERTINEPIRFVSRFLKEVLGLKLAGCVKKVNGKAKRLYYEIEEESFKTLMFYTKSRMEKQGYIWSKVIIYNMAKECVLTPSNIKNNEIEGGGPKNELKNCSAGSRADKTLFKV